MSGTESLKCGRNFTHTRATARCGSMLKLQSCWRRQCVKTCVSANASSRLMGSKAVTCTGVTDERGCESTGKDVADCGSVLAEDARRFVYRLLQSPMAPLSKHFCAFGCSSIGRRASLLHCLNKCDITDSALGFIYCPFFCSPERRMSCLCSRGSCSSRYFNVRRWTRITIKRGQHMYIITLNISADIVKQWFLSCMWSSILRVKTLLVGAVAIYIR